MATLKFSAIWGLNKSEVFSSADILAGKLITSRRFQKFRKIICLFLIFRLFYRNISARFFFCRYLVALFWLAYTETHNQTVVFLIQPPLDNGPNFWVSRWCSLDCCVNCLTGRVFREMVLRSSERHVIWLPDVETSHLLTANCSWQWGVHHVYYFPV